MIKNIKQNRIVIFLVFLVVFGCSAIKRHNTISKFVTNDDINYLKEDKESDSNSLRKLFKTESQNLLSKSYELILPEPFRLQKEKIDEGVFYNYSFIDSTQIIIFEGAMLFFDIDDYKPDSTFNNRYKKTSIGRVNNKFWRKDIIENVKLYYKNVSAENKPIYDKVLDSVIIKSL